MKGGPYEMLRVQIHSREEFWPTGVPEIWA